MLFAGGPAFRLLQKSRADDRVLVVEHGGLSGCDGAHRRFKPDYKPCRRPEAIWAARRRPRRSGFHQGVKAVPVENAHLPCEASPRQQSRSSAAGERNTSRFRGSSLCTYTSSPAPPRFLRWPIVKLYIPSCVPTCSPVSSRTNLPAGRAGRALSRNCR